MARPKDWHPLRESDPVPGDPEGIRSQVKHMKKIAEYLRTQAAALNAMADADNLKGKYAEKLGEDARGLGRKLDEAEDRYREVKGHLSNWANELEDIQQKADTALDDAKDAQRTIDSRTAKDDSKAGDDKTKKKESGSASDEDPALKRAQNDLEDAGKRLNSAEGDYIERSNHFAGKIRNSIDDDMKDSWWTDFKAWVADAEWLKTWTERLSWFATAFGALAMLIPVVGWVALGLTIVVALSHLTLAATGNGSWFDVVMDIGALKMARNGLKAAKAIKALQQSSRKTAAGMANDGAKTQAAAANAGARKTAARSARKRGGTSSRNRKAANARRLRMENANRTAGKRAADDVRDADLPQATLGDRARTIGDARLSQQMKDIKKWRDEYPDNTTLADNAVQAQRQQNLLQGSWAVGTGLDLGDKFGNDLSDGEYDRMKGRMEAPVGQW
ncbi:putative T7SS-secreted protein [Streptomyces sp. NPDC056296]|uniref:putative T7SS-secreted protein n=1 Tax=Streptomyces sp. NPDC056296 TaxID=3345775 RepID=UPI0035E37D16